MINTAVMSPLSADTDDDDSLRLHARYLLITFDMHQHVKMYECDVTSDLVMTFLIIQCSMSVQLEYILEFEYTR